MYKVAVVKCGSYDSSEVMESLNRALALIGGIDTFLPASSSGTILLKPNLLAGEPPEKAVTTHPSVMQAIATTLLQKECQVQMGDSPGLGDPFKTAVKSGLQPVYDLGVLPADFETVVEMHSPDGRVSRRLPTAAAVAGADLVVSCAKLKTHALQIYTGGVKNLYGCLVGLNKAKQHFRYPDRDVFADFLLDIYTAVMPGLTIIDGIMAMEGNGPRTGTPRKAGVLIVSGNALAADLAALQVIGFSPNKIPIFRAAKKRNLRPFSIDEIQWLGDDLADVQIQDFVPAVTTRVSFGPQFLQRPLRNLLIAYPDINATRCQSCGACMKICPAKALKMVGGQVRLSRSKCITCYCCHEACTYGAIDLHCGVLGRTAAKLMRTE
ncbi:MAG TPA: iron-sulfur cluster-binding protein [Firmicutes bacterium]|nr:iron-sulfur cluster-binding protein [Bacillota bacterium]HAZ21453.1 iron-sulfur cluster-binding protein [Bacillota bacterium]HBE05973.1 iron-sulfur cluster-binding protein [Bacillota bacterium]HBG43558.1 iron-sulfur cluster-binding protein [Bacillota bacterium]HBL68916.1 iron-sulfur cluster-binding protein [Bacillota bacterium]